MVCKHIDYRHNQPLTKIQKPGETCPLLVSGRLAKHVAGLRSLQDALCNSLNPQINS